jgi:hypothetical protein
VGSTPPVIPTQSSLGPATSTWANLVKQYLEWHESVTKTDSRPYAILRATSSQTLSAATLVAISLDTETADVGNGHSGTSASYTIPTAGLWDLRAIATFSSTATTNVCKATVTLNGNAVAYEQANGTNVGLVIMSMSCLAVCSVGDTVQLQQFSTVATTTDVATISPSLYAYRLNS